MRPDSRGPLYPARLPTFHRLPPEPRVARFVRWFWIPQWRLPPGRTSRQHLIAYPACNLVVEPDAVGVAGPATRASFRDLTGNGWAVGALLRPAAVPPLVGDPTVLRDGYRLLDAARLRDAVSAALRDTGDPQEERERAVRVFTEWMCDRLPPPGEEALLANRLVDVIDGDSRVLRLGDVAQRLHVSGRTVQRLARRYVGVPPAAMIRRRRLQEAAERLRTDPGTDLACLAADLGYADQSHLAGDFRRVLGFTPSHYRRTARDESVPPAG